MELGCVFGNCSKRVGVVVDLLMMKHKVFLVGGFNPFEKYESKWKSSPNRGENIKYLKPPTRFGMCKTKPHILWKGSKRSPLTEKDHTDLRVFRKS